MSCYLKQPIICETYVWVKRVIYYDSYFNEHGSSKSFPFGRDIRKAEIMEKGILFHCYNIEQSRIGNIYNISGHLLQY